MPSIKQNIADLALFGGEPAFLRPLPTSNLARPDFDAFLGYSRLFFDAHQYSNKGPASILLEERLAEFHQAREAVVFSSGFWGLALAIAYLALPARSEVLIPALTYRRMADVVAWCGLVPRFCDVEEGSLAASPATVKPHLSEKTALILAAHPMVNCCDATGFEQLSMESGVPLLIDSVESAYEVCQGRRVGSFGHAELFSMHASKLINAMEGGYVVTGDPELARRLRLARAFGFHGRDNLVERGLNAKLNEVHAAMGLASLDGVDAQVEENRSRYNAYRALLADLPAVRLRPFDESERPGYKNIVVELLDGWQLSRSTILSILEAERVLARAYYSPALHLKAGSYPSVRQPLPNAERLAERLVMLPCGYQVSEEDIGGVVDLLVFIAGHQGEIVEAMAG